MLKLFYVRHCFDLNASFAKMIFQKYYQPMQIGHKLLQSAGRYDTIIQKSAIRHNILREIIHKSLVTEFSRHI
jgi:hypothetical protein